MSIMQLIKERRSIRKYRPDPIEPEKLAQIAEAFRLAPSARNLQRWKLYIVTDPAARERISNGSPTKNTMAVEAPCVLVVTGTTQDVMANGHRVDTTDGSIALSFAMLAAQELGLGTCWMGYYTEDGIRKALGLPEDISIVAIMPLGYPDESPNARPRNDVCDVVEYV